MAERKAGGLLGEAAYYGLAVLFCVVPRLLYDVHVEEDGPATFPPSTLIVTNHKRDLDSVLLPATLFWRNRRYRAPISFAGREDMFLRGFLAQFEVLPSWLRRMLYAIDLRPVMRALRIAPVRRFAERTMEEALREALEVRGDRPLAEVLIPDEAALVAGVHGPAARLSQALGWEFYQLWRRPARMGAFQPEVRELIRERQREVVRAQMQTLADVLGAGGILYLAPEGVISPDGRLQAFRSGLRQVLELACARVQIQPACIAYDFMRPGRLRVLMTIGRGFPVTGPAEQAAALARQGLAALHPMSGSQLCSYALWEAMREGRDAVDARKLEHDVRGLAALLAEEGLRIDQGFLADRPTRVAEWVRFAQQKGILAARGARLVVNRSLILGRPATHWDNPIRYCVNEVQSVREALRGTVAAATVSG